MLQWLSLWSIVCFLKTLLDMKHFPHCAQTCFLSLCIVAKW